MTDSQKPKRRVRRAVVFLYSAIAIILVATAYEQYTLTAFHATANARKEAIIGLLRIEKTLSLFKDLETGPRGFALTGDESYLAPYHAALKSLPGEITRIEAGFSGLDTADFSWADFHRLIAHRLAIAAQVIKERREGRNIVFDEKPLLYSGKQTMDAIRQNFAILADHQRAFIEAKNAELSRANQMSLIVSWLASGLTILLMGLSIHLFLSERRIRRQLAADLRLAHDTLEERVATRTRELAAARNRIAGFADELDHQVEAERLSLSREVHDQLGPIFTAIRMALMGLPPGALPREQAAMLDQSLDTGVATTRRIAAELRPPLLDDLGLEAAVQHFVAGLFQNSGVHTTVVLADHKHLGERQALSVFRLIQEAATNVVRHAGAANFAIQGACSADAYEITMADDGKGMDLGKIRPGALGLNNMRERAELLGAAWAIDSQPGTGTRLRLLVPLADQTEREIREDTAA